MMNYGMVVLSAAMDPRFEEQGLRFTQEDKP
jgi:hypothetical protein